ncbi:hypothetical protein RUM44_005687 [Polyplax serrata]|uniref:Uncharacterized protein n=1 Tax=Polyplax serrata TaxID=468196 RepID=A0ABR1AW99_POLSC
MRVSKVTDEYDEDDMARDDNYPNYNEEVYSHYDNEMTKSKRDPAFTPYISVGALSNIQQFFENLKGNFKSLEGLSQEERNALMGKQELPTDPKLRVRRTYPYLTAGFRHRF